MPPYCEAMFTYSTSIFYKSQQLNYVRFRCRCGCCSNEFVIEAKECHCCTEVPKCIDALTLANSEQLCITNHPGFNAICLNRWALELASDNYRTRGGLKYRQGDRSVLFQIFRLLLNRCFTPGLLALPYSLLSFIMTCMQ